ncbi:MAG: purine phosphoribosyltransferase family protein [Pirellulales bacterium]
MTLKEFIRDVPDAHGQVLFKDITPLLGSPGAFRETIMRLAEPFRGKRFRSWCCRNLGLYLCCPAGDGTKCGLCAGKKAGKLPFTTHSFSYELEYGSDTLQMHIDGVQPGEKVVVDDLLATGGTVGACCKMLSSKQIEACVLISWNF